MNTLNSVSNMKSKTKRTAIIGVLTVAMVTLGIAGGTLMANATDSGDPSPAVLEKIVDLPSDYEAHMREPGDTSEVGRIKTDKTVRKVGFEKIDRTTGEPINPEDIGDNYTVTFSALSSGGNIAGQSTVPADVVLILDTSISMNRANGSESRAAAMVDAVNETIDELVTMNPDNRIAVVGFGTDSSVMVPLQSIEPLANKQYFTISNRSVGATSITITPHSSITSGAARAFDNGTNTQSGIWRGMDILTNSDSKVTIGGTEYDRVPGVILITDGAAGDFVLNSNWWDLSSGTNYHAALSTGTGRMAHWFAPILEASYMKEKASANYGENDCFVATVGFDLANASSNERAIANLVLNPSEYIADDGTITVVPRGGLTRGVDTQFKTAYTNLIVNHTTAALPYTGQTTPTHQFNYPSGDAAQYMPENFKYNDVYVDVDNAEDLASQLSETISAITDKAYAPTNVTDMTGEQTGYITFTDTIGELMEVKNFDSILWVDHNPESPTYRQETEYTNVQKSTSGNVDTYVFDAVVNSSWLYNYESTNLNKIIITVDRSGNNEVVTIKIPPALLPMVDYEVKKSGGTVTSVTRNEETRPIKINYIVGPKEGVVDYIAGDSSAITDEDLKAQVDAYVADSSHKVTTADGKSGIGLYTNTWEGSDETVVPVASFNINPLNDYYSFAKRTALYTDSDCTTQATSFSAGTTYYYKHDVYVVGQTGAAADRVLHTPVTGLSAADTEVVGGLLYVKAGVDKPVPADTPKEANATQTKSYRLRSHWQDGTTLHQHQGNNGLMIVEQPGQLKLDKTITLDEDLQDPAIVAGIDTDKMNAKEFEFQLALQKSATDSSAVTGDFDYVITHPGEADVTGTISNGGTVKLTEDDTLLIKGLPNGTKYTWTESNIPAGYKAIKSTTTYKELQSGSYVDRTVDNTTASDAQKSITGYITSGNTSTAEFTNEYSFDGNPKSISQRPYVRKVLTGRAFNNSDDFFILIAPYEDNPAAVTLNPTDGKLDVGLTHGNVVANEDAPNGDHRIENVFKGITFTVPGTYRFRIAEENTGVAGITYSQSVYMYTVIVKDDGDGTMSIDEDGNGIHMEKVINIDGTSVPADDPEREVQPEDVGGHKVYRATFTNDYEPTEITIGTPGVKTYLDTTGANPLTAHKFQFELRPSFYDENGTLLPDTDLTGVPMPTGADEDSEEVEGTTYTFKKKDTDNSASGDFGFGTITFNQDDVGNTYRYVVQEIIPDEALTDGTKTYVKRGSDPAVIEETSDYHGYLWHREGEVWDLKTIRHKGYDYDCSRHLVKVVVTEEDGHIAADVQYYTSASESRQEVAISNTYAPDPATTTATENQIDVNKKLVGRELKDGETFTFSMAAAGANAQAGIAGGYITLPEGQTWPAKATVDRLDANGEADAFFEGVTFKRPGTYTFAITENAGNEGGMSYDDHTCIAVVTVADNEGQLEISDVNYTGSRTFTNIYTAKSVDYGSQGAMQIEKKVDGRAMIAGKYRFVVVATNDNAKAKTPNSIPAAITGYSESAAAVVINSSAAPDGQERGTQALTDLRFTTEDAGKTFTYKVAEVIPSGATRNSDGTYTYEGVTYAYDGKGIQNVTFEVTDKGDGTLEVKATDETTGDSVTSTSAGDGTIVPLEVHFANKYEYTPATYPSSVYNKTITGRNWEEGDEFTFEMTASDGAPLPKKDGNTNTTETVRYGDQTGASAAFRFGDATFTKPGTYTYTVTERGVDGEIGTGGTKDGLTYDSTSHTIQVIVTDNGDGTLNVRSTAAGDIRAFTNKYSASIDFTDESDLPKAMVDAKKTMDGRAMWQREILIDVRPIELIDDETGDVKEGYVDKAETKAKFGMQNVYYVPLGGTIGQASTTAQAGAIFGTLFTEKDAGKTYTFEVREFVPAEAVDKELNGKTYKYNEGVYYNTNGVDHFLVEISVEDAGKGKLQVVTKYTGHDAAHNVVNDDEGHPITKSVTSVTGEELQNLAVPFENTYKSEGEATINAIKDLEGREWKNSDAYEFKIERMKLDEATGKLVDDPDNDSKSPLPSGYLTAKKDTEEVGSDGTLHRAVRNPSASAADYEYGWNLQFDQDDLTTDTADLFQKGDFYYKITEVIPNDAEEDSEGNFVKNGVKYSTTPRYVRVQATDNQSGGISTDVDYVTADEPTEDLGITPVFTNYYTATGEAQLKVSKTIKNWSGAWTDADVYTFTLIGRNGDEPLPETAERTVTIDKGTENHTASFGKIKFEEPGTYHYRITEGEVNVPGVTRDPIPHRYVEVVVGDATDGTLTIDSVKYYYDSAFDEEQVDQSAALFENVYKATTGDMDTEDLFKTTKKITGRYFREDGAFTFSIAADTAGAPLPTVATKVVYPTAGSDSYDFDFGTIKFTEEHLALSPMVYTITEVRGDTDGITYDSHEEKVQVELTDNADGTLTATATKLNTGEGDTSRDAIEFVNKYDAQGSATISAVKDLQREGLDWLASDNFNFAIEPVDGSGRTWQDFDEVPEGYPLPNNGTTNNQATASDDSKMVTAEQRLAEPVWTLTLTEDKLTYNTSIKRMTGDFYYKIYEIVPADAENAQGVKYSDATPAQKKAGGFVKNGMTYDSSEQYVHVHAEDDRHGIILMNVYYGEERPGDTASAVATSPVFTNEFTSPTGSIEVTKTWNDKDNRDGKRTDAVMHLFKQVGNKWVQVEVPKMTLATGDDHETKMTDKWENLPIYESDGITKITYKVEEESIAGYRTTITPATLTLNVDDAATQADESAAEVGVTNAYDPATTTVKVTKNWDDSNNQSGLRPESVEVKLLANGQPAKDKNGEDVEPLTLNERGNWKGEFTNLPEQKDGVKIDYTVTETALDSDLGYEDAVITGCASKGYTITNTRKPTYVDVSVTKVWDDDDNQDGIRPNYVEMQLYKKLSGSSDDPEPVNGKIIRVTGNDNEDRWTGTMTGLLKYEQGKEVIYSFDEVTTPTGYTKTVSADGLTITNTHTDAKGTLVISKLWDDNNNQDDKRDVDAFVAALHVYADGTEITGKTPQVATSGSTTTVTYEGMDVYTGGGTKVKYSATEDTITDYTLISNSGEVELTQNQTSRISLRNQHLSDTKSVHFTKIWNDGGNQDGQRPSKDDFVSNLELRRQDDSVVNWASDDRISISVDTSDPDEWTVTWSGLYVDMPGQSGVPAVYHAVEKQAFDNYAAPEYDNTGSTHPAATDGVYDGGTVINAHNPSTVKVTGVKEWAGDTGYESMRPDSVTVEILDGTRVVDTVTTSAQKNWAFESKELPKFKGGDEISYTVREQTVTGYAVTYAPGTTANNWTITNTLETTSISGIKLWDDDKNVKGLRPAEITLKVMNGNTQVTTTKVSGNATDQVWNYTIDGLPKYNKTDGSTADYTIEEVAVPEYETQVLYKTTVINTLKTHDITGTKKWVDGGKKHDNTTEVKLAVYRSNDGRTWESDPLPAARYHVDWKGNDYTISGLADTDTEGNTFYYKVVETETPAGYTVSYENDGATLPALTDGASSGGKIVNTINQDKATFHLTAEKKMEGRDFRKGDEFTFKVEAANNAPMPKDATGADVTSVTIKPTSGDTATIDFGTITFDNADVPDEGVTYTYTVSEQIPTGDQHGITYDRTADQVTVKVERVDGILTVTATPDAAPYASFTNKYEGQDTVKAELKSTKKLNRNFNDNDNFKFVVTAKDGTPMPEETLVVLSTSASDDNAKLPTDKKTKTFSFGEVTYSIDDLGDDDSKVFTYDIVEAAANQGGITYHTDKETLYVKVTKQGNGTLKVEYSTDNGTFAADVTNFEWPIFTNNYDAEGVVVPAVKKEVTGAQLTAEQFEFEIAAKTNGAPMPDVTKAKNKGDGNVNFDSIKYTLADAGKTYEYTIKEVVPSGVNANNPTKDGVTYDLHEVTMKVTVADNGDGSVTATANYEGATTFTNKVAGKGTNITVIKKWEDANNQDNVRPDNITVVLTDANGNEMATDQLTKAGNWAHTFTDLPIYDGEGNRIEYKVKELSVDKYTTAAVTGTGTAQDPFVITNTHTPETYGDPTGPTDPDDPNFKGIKATKVWNDEDNQLGLRTDVKFTLVGTAGNETLEFETKTLELADAANGNNNTWKSVGWTGVPKYHNGVPVTYTVHEDAVYGYTTTVSGNVNDGFVVTNKGVETPEVIKVTKTWNDADNKDGIRPATITFILEKKVGSGEPEVADRQEVNVAADGSASYTWDNLPATDGTDPIMYSVTEAPVTGYTTRVLASTTPGEFEVVNTHEPATVSIKARKIWNDSNNAKGNRPAYVVFQLLKDGKEIGAKTLSADGATGDWADVIWEGLAKPASGNPQDVYKVEEVPVTNYTSSVVWDDSYGGYIVTNTYNDDMSVEVTITWVDEHGNELTEAPVDSTFTLMKRVAGEDGVPVEGAEVKNVPAGATGDDLTLTWGGLPSAENGKAITYYVAENKLEDYDTSYEGGKVEGTTVKLSVTNTGRPGSSEDPNETVLVSFVDYLNPEGSQVVKLVKMKRADLDEFKTFKPANPSHEGYKFQQWDKNENSIEEGDIPSYKPTAEGDPFTGGAIVTYVAQYQDLSKKLIRVSYVDPMAPDKDALLVSKAVTSEKDVKKPANPKHDGYTFVKWTRTVDDAGNIIYAAQYKCNHDNNGGNGNGGNGDNNGGNGNDVNGGNGDNNGGNGGNNGTPGSVKPAKVRTGDPAGSTAAAALAASSLALLIATKRRKKHSA